MRVIAGSAKGTKLISAQGLKTRPTGDRVKEALFNILGPTISDSSFLDLYAGSGAIGLEALSRGAKDVVWVEEDPTSIEKIHVNLARTRLSGGIVYKVDVFKALIRLEQDNQKFDYIFLDPPYEQGLIKRTLEHLAKLSLLNNDGIIIAEASKKEEAPSDMSKLCLKRKQQYGDTMLLFYVPRRN